MYAVYRIRGFTLLEVMVVLAIIGGLLAMASLSFNRHHSLEQAQEFGQLLVTYMGVLQDEASLQNLDLGLVVSEDELQLLAYQPKQITVDDVNKAQSSNLDAAEEEPEHPWKTYQGNLKPQLKTAESILLRLELEGQEVDLSQQFKNDTLTPALLFLSADEYTPFKLYIEHSQDPSFSVIISGDGLAPIQMYTEVVDEN